MSFIIFYHGVGLFFIKKYGFGILAIEFPWFESQWFNKEEI